MKLVFFFLLLANFAPSFTNGQKHYRTNLDSQIRQIANDTSGVNFLLGATLDISHFDIDSGRKVAEKALKIAREINYKKGEAVALNEIGETYHFQGEYAQALKYLFQAGDLDSEIGELEEQSATFSAIGMIFSELGQYSKALDYLKQSLKIVGHLNSTYKGSFELANIGDIYRRLNMPDSAFYYYRRAAEKYVYNPSYPHVGPFVFRHTGDGYAETQEYDSALRYYHESIRQAIASNDLINVSNTQSHIAKVYEILRQYDSAFHYARQSFKIAQTTGSKTFILESGNLLSGLFKRMDQPDSALFYEEIASAMKDSLYGPDKLRQLQLLMLDEQQKQNLLERKQEQYQHKMRYIALVSALMVFTLVMFLLWRNNRHKKRANVLLEKEKQNVEQAYLELQATQAQLIQREKMASLGELTAGIAHEIQNPLNFVNNFSEVNNDLIEELKNEKSGFNDGEQQELLNTIFENNEKILFHGKRADAIVKGMLQHSRASTGKKEVTDINNLCDQSLRLSYQGLRAKDQTFSAQFKTAFDELAGKIEVVPQDIERVVLNLCNNAFYAVREKKKISGENYVPEVIVQTRRAEDNSIEIKVKDNGNGIPQNIVDKVFQPFFTTKPTGEGTGLGLSLSYDIISKGHKGQMTVESKESVGSEFTITLPGK
ncbi:MAG: tetratricopeptide repeat-containing sensor histidine kinase [Ginsengibacter sp.]